MSDILLVQPPIRDFFLTVKRTLPYGLASIAAALRREGFSVELFDALATTKARTVKRPAELDHLQHYYARADRSPFSLFHRFRHFGRPYAAVARAARSSGAFLVGISSLFTPYHREALQAAESVKEALPDCRIVLGGHHATLAPEDILNNTSVDFVLRGDGEAGMPALARLLSTGGDPAQIPGLVFRKTGGGLHRSDPAVAADLDALAPPAKDLFDHRFYRRKEGPATVITASRGCPLQCSYCCMGSGAAMPYRRRSVASVMAEIEEDVRLRGVRFIDFEDENLSLDRQWFLDLLDRIRQRFGGRLVLRAMNGLYPASLDERVVAAMKAAGFEALNLSLGTFSIEQMQRFRRKPLGEEFDLVLSLAEGNHMPVVGYILAGAPYQRAEDSVTDLVRLAERRVLVGLSVFYPVPGTVDYERCRRASVLPDSIAAYRSSALPVGHTTSRLELVTLLRLARLLNFMKSLVDRSERLPEPAPISTGAVVDVGDRIELGRLLLAGFLHDGKIRGALPDGRVYEHLCNPQVAAAFLRGIASTELRGTGA
ncbi:MAG: B12-binding domain-containing radical SAM protein [Desulfobacteraceae bacterium]|nr:B12-binding domain-containing radical SAM protein [Desulfobacteraceae bacterium]